MKAMLRLKTVKHPISESVIGFRIEAAIPNKAGKAFGKEVPSFKKPYFIAQSSDHSEAFLKEHFSQVVEKMKADLKWQGVNESFFI